MILGILWWGYLLSQKNQEVFALKKSRTTDAVAITQLENEQSRQSFMILGEGIVLGFSLLLGIYIINRSANKEIQNAKQQSDFLLSVSHELKSPIAAIKLALQTVTRPGLSEAKQRSFQLSALEDTERLEKLVQNILLSASIESEALELYKTEFDIIELVEQLVKHSLTHNNQELIQKSKIKIVTDLDECIVKADRQNLRQALLNILDNALKYSNEEGWVIIEIAKLNSEVELKIINSGPAIAAADHTKIFEKFYRGNHPDIRKKEGTGIGLYITKEIIRAHKGEIKVKSENGQNSFTVMIPINE